MTESSRFLRQNAGRAEAVDAGPAPAGEPDRAPPAFGPPCLVPILLCAQAALFLAFTLGRLELPAYLACHLGLCAVAAIVGGRWAMAPSAPNPSDRIAMVAQVVGWTALAGPFGSVIALGLLIPRAAARPDVGSEPNATLSRLELLHGSLLDRRLRLDRAHATRPLLDVVIDGAQSEKFDALSLMAKRFVPALAPALKQALEDKDGSVRVLAATVMARQHNACTRRIGDAQAMTRAAPEAPEGWRELGQAHLDYARSGLLEASRADTELGHARAHLTRAEQLDHGEQPTGIGVAHARQVPSHAH
jgi:hypothetical protein